MRRKIYEMHSVVVIHDVSPGSFAKYLGGDKRHTENYAEPIMEFQVWGCKFSYFSGLLNSQFMFWKFNFTFEIPKLFGQEVSRDKIPISAKYLGGDKRHTENYAESIMEFQVWGSNF